MFSKLILFFLLNLVLTIIAQNDELWDTYAKCRDTLGKPNWLCDPNNQIYDQTAKEINDLLWQLQTEVPCYCRYTNDCYRYVDMQKIQSGVVGAMIITPKMPDAVDATAKRIYKDAGLATANCSNGLLIVYAYENPQLFTYRGELTEQTLHSSNALKIMNDTIRDISSGSDYQYTLTELIRKYISWLKGQTFDRQRTWEAMVGMVVAVVICAFAAAAAVGIFFAYCCCKKRRKHAAQMDPSQRFAYLEAPPRQKLHHRLRKNLVNRIKVNKKKIMTTKSGKKLTPKRLVKAHNRNLTRRNKALKGQQGTPPMMHYPPSEEPYYVISEPSTMYSTLPRDSPVEGPQRGYPYSRPHPISATPTVTYPESTVSEAYLIPRSLSPLPEQETQRRTIFVNDEDETKTADTFKTATTTGTYKTADTVKKV